MDDKTFVAVWFFAVAVYFIYLIISETLSYKKEKERPKFNNFLVFHKEFDQPGRITGFVENVEKAREIVAEYDEIHVSEKDWEEIKIIRTCPNLEDKRIIFRVHAEFVKRRTSWS